MSRFREFVQTLGKSLNPSRYNELNKTSLAQGISYFLVLVCFTTLVATLLFIPKMLTLGDYINDGIDDAFDKLSIEVLYDQNEPLVFTKNYPVITIDTLNEHNSIDKGFILIAENETYYRWLPFGSAKVIEDTENLVDRSDEVSEFLTVIILMMIPMIIAFAYFYFVLKFALIAFIGTLVAFILARIIRFGVSFGELFKIALYASTIMVLIGLLTKPFVPFIAYLDYIAFIVLFFMAAIRLGDFEEVVKPEKKQH